MEISTKLIEEALNGLFRTPSEAREPIIYTGIGGYDMFIEATENYMGLVRFYLPNKLPRIIKNYRVSPTGRKYRLLK